MVQGLVRIAGRLYQAWVRHRRKYRSQLQLSLGQCLPQPQWRLCRCDWFHGYAKSRAPAVTLGNMPLKLVRFLNSSSLSVGVMMGAELDHRKPPEIVARLITHQRKVRLACHQLRRVSLVVLCCSV